MRYAGDVREVSHIGGVYARQVLVDSVRGRMYVVVEGEGGLERLLIYDVRDVANPVELSGVDLGEDRDGRVDLGREDTLLFIGVGRSMRVLGVWDPYNPVVLGELWGDTEVVEVELGDSGVVYVLWCDDTLSVVDVGDVSEPEVLVEYDLGDLINWPDEYIIGLSDMEYWRGYLMVKVYLFDLHEYLWETRVVDFRDIYAPELVEAGWIPGSGMLLVGDRLYLTQWSHLWVYELSEDPFEAEYLGEYDMYGIYNGFWGVDVESNLIYVRTGGRGLQIFHYVNDTLGVSEGDVVRGGRSGVSEVIVVRGGVCSIGLDLPNSGFVRMVVYDVMGRYVGEVYRGELSRGRQEVKIDLSGLGSGVYFLRVEGCGVDEVRRVLVVR